jgi:hypothetical protein
VDRLDKPKRSVARPAADDRAIDAPTIARSVEATATGRTGGKGRARD